MKMMTRSAAPSTTTKLALRPASEVVYPEPFLRFLIGCLSTQPQPWFLTRTAAHSPNSTHYRRPSPHSRPPATIEYP